MAGTVYRVILTPSQQNFWSRYEKVADLFCKSFNFCIIHFTILGYLQTELRFWPFFFHNRRPGGSARWAPILELILTFQHQHMYLISCSYDKMHDFSPKSYTTISVFWLILDRVYLHSTHTNCPIRTRNQVKVSISDVSSNTWLKYSARIHKFRAWPATSIQRV